MDLLLEVVYAAGTTGSGTDVCVELDPDDTVASLADALAAYGARQGLATAGSGLPVWRSGSDLPLDPRARVLDTGLVSGETVTLGPTPATPPAGVGPLSLDIATGPEAGRIVPLGVASYTVGRGAGCSLVVDDPTMSREHFLLRVGPDGSLELVPNPAATNGTAVNTAPVTAPCRIAPGDVVQAGASAFVVRAAAPDETRRRDRLGQIPFNRVPYRRTVVTPRHLDDVAAPPRPAESRRLSLATAVSPAVTAVALALMMQRWYLLALAGLSPLLFLYRWVSDRRSGRRTYERERLAFHERVEARAGEIDRALAEERQERLAAAPDLADLARQAMLHMPRLWERNRDVGDVLELRLGLGDLESHVVAGIERGGDDELAAQGTARLAHHAVVRDVPVTVNLVELGVLGLWGHAGQARSLTTALLAQAACLHSPEDLVVAAAVADDDVHTFSWLKWLPHVRSATSPLEGPHLHIGPAGTRRLLVNLLRVAADRSARERGGMQAWPRVLVVLAEAAEPDRALLSQLLDVAPAVGVHVVWMGESELQVPRQCRATVACAGPEMASRVTFTDPGRPPRTVELDGARPSAAHAIARALAPLRDASAGTQTTAIPRVVPLLDALGIGRPEAEEIARRWQTPRPYGLDVAIGMTADGPFHLDLVEQGPHTLIGGTSGAGKSELLQTLVLSLAATYPPERLNFLFVDYKGGASSADFRDLPHTVGYVTNLSGRLGMRALTSLRAELQRRMGLLEGRAKDLAEMLQLAPDEAPPSLVIVVDEFAALVKEIPDFVAGMVDIAQRGRSLGIHLVLATQRPRGVVNENILANTNLRISLRVLDPSDSSSIIGTRDAADIPVPLRGRAYARTGPHALVPFQCAWAGAPFVAGHGGRDVVVRPFSFGSPASPADGVAAAPGAGGDADAPTQLELVVRAVADAARSLRSRPARRPWVEPLATVVPLDDVLARVAAGQLGVDPAADPGRIAVLGLADQPEIQAQRVAAIDLEAAGGLLVFGMGGSGKTTLLRTVAAGMARQGDAGAVQLHVLDFASRSLDALAELPQCAAVVPGDDLERVTRLLTVLDAEIERRRGVLAEARAESLSALRARAGAPVMPRLVLLLDSYSGFHGAFDRPDGHGWLTQFQRIVSTGRQAGVHCIVTTERRLGLPSALVSAVSARVALRMASAEELASLGVPTKLARDAELPGGRGFLDGATEVQVACVSDDPAGSAQSDAVARVGAAAIAAGARRAPRLPELPGEVTLDDDARGPCRAPLAVEDLTLAPLDVDLTRQHLVVAGPPLSGRSTALATVAHGLRASTGSALHLAALGTPASPLAGLDVWDDAAFSRGGHAGLVARVGELLAGEEGVDARVVLVVDTAEDVEGNDVVRPLEALCRSDALRLVVACEPATLAKAYSGWVAALRRNRTALLLQPESRAEIDTVLGVKVALRPGQPFPPGRGVLVANRRWSLVQVGRVRAPVDGAPLE